MRSDILNVNSQQTGSLKKKVVNLTVAATLTEEDSGKVFAVDSAGGAYAITLPTTLEDGIFYKFVVWEETPTADVTIAAGSAIISGVNKMLVEMQLIQLLEHKFQMLSLILLLNVVIGFV